MVLCNCSTDFVVNGGIRQPGCLTSLCSHAKALLIFSGMNINACDWLIGTGHIQAKAEDCLIEVHFFLPIIDSINNRNGGIYGTQCTSYPVVSVVYLALNRQSFYSSNFLRYQLRILFTYFISISHSSCNRDAPVSHALCWDIVPIFRWPGRRVSSSIRKMLRMDRSNGMNHSKPAG